MKQKFALIRANEDFTFDFIPGLTGKLEEVTDEEMEEYAEFWDTNNEHPDLPMKELLERVIAHFTI